MKFIAFIIYGNNAKDVIHLGDFVSSEVALDELKEYVKENTIGFVELKKCILYEIQKGYEVDLQKMFKSIEEEEILRQKQEEEKEERELFERLKKKYG